MRIGDFSFSHTNISTITIPEGVTSIGDNCFNECKRLTSIHLPSTLKIICCCAFFNTGISEITIPKRIKRYECEVPIFIKKILREQGIECPN